MKLVIGLGNFENKYLFTRHNAGFIAVDIFAKNYEFKTEKKLKSMITKFKLDDEDFIVIKPLTFMNLSGEAVVAVMNFYKIDINDILVVYDDICLDIGKVRFRGNGSDGGHNGIKSIIKNLGSKDFARLKIGIGPQPNIPSEAFVLQNFTKQQLLELKNLLDKPMIEDFFKYGLQKVQNTYN